MGDQQSADGAQHHDEQMDGSGTLQMIEDAVVSVVRFVVGFVRTTLLFVARPRRAVDVVAERGPGLRGMPRPFTFLAVSFFFFFQLVDMQDKGWLQDGIQSAEDVVNVPALQEKLTNVSFEHFILTTLPATALVLVVATFLLRVSGERDAGRARVVTGVTSYTVGAHLVALMLVIHLFDAAQHHTSTMLAEGHALTKVVLGARVALMVYILLTPSIVLFRWFGKTANPSWLFRLWPARLVVVIGCSFAMVVSSFWLAEEMRKGFETDVKVHVSSVAARRREDSTVLSLTMYAHNYGTTTYFVDDHGWFEVYHVRLTEEAGKVQRHTVNATIRLDGFEGRKHLELAPGGVLSMTGTVTLTPAEYDRWGNVFSEYRFGIRSTAFCADGSKRHLSLRLERDTLWAQWPEDYEARKAEPLE